ncbi:MAG: glycosyltransferase family 2 protein [Oscillospiraceae bacterium]
MEQRRYKGEMEVEQPLVSIIIPVFNTAQHLATCLESVRRQTYRNLEILLVNDGSKDASRHIINMYAGVDKRIVAINKQNGGISASRNFALCRAKGEYIQFADSDDYLDENATRLMVEKAQQNKADLVIAHYCHVYKQEVKVHGFLRTADAIDKNAFALQLMEEPASFYYGVMWNKLYRADIIHQHNIRCNEAFSWSEDFLFNLEYIRYANRFVALKTPVYYYVYNEKSILHSQIKTLDVLQSKLELFTYYKELYQKLGLYEKFRPQIYRYLLSSAEHS